MLDVPILVVAVLSGFLAATPQSAPDQRNDLYKRGPGVAIARPSARPGLMSDSHVSHRLAGIASWYCLPGRSACTVGYSANDCRTPVWHCYAAAGPALRAVLGNWQDREILVSFGDESVLVRIVDICTCPGGRLIDLYASTFGHLASLSTGTIELAVLW